MAASRTATVANGPTLASLRAIEDVLRAAREPLSRYAIRQKLGNRIAAPLLDQALAYMAEHGMVYDEGPGGEVVWIKVSPATLAKIRGA